MKMKIIAKKKKAKTGNNKKEDIVDFDAINDLILKKYPKLDTKNLELIKFLTIFDILFEKANKTKETTETAENKIEEIDSVDGLPEIIKIICKTLLEILSEGLHEIKLPPKIKKILIKLKKVLKITQNGKNKNDSEKGQFKVESSSSS